MARIKLTAAAVVRMRAPATGRVDCFDTVLPGFMLRVTDKGSKSWSVVYRMPGNPKLRRYTIGSYPAFSLVEARTAAREALQMVATGTDPAAEKARQRRRIEPERPDTFANIVAEFTKRHIEKKRPRTQIEMTRPITKWLLPRWGDRLVGDISRRDIIALIDEIVDGGAPIAANRALATVRKFFNWCVGRGILEASPCVLIEPPGKETKRDRELTDDEIRALWPAYDSLGNPFGAVMKMLLLTGQRRTEVGTMQWSDVDLDAGHWTLAAADTKAGRPHLVPLSRLAIEVLESLPRFTSDYVFSTSDGSRPVSGFSRVKRRLDKLVKEAAEGSNLPDIPAWRLHDLRRTCATGMRRLRVTRDVVGAVLNHAPRGVTAEVYDQYDLLDEKRDALALWSTKIESLIQPVPSKVVELRGRA